MAVAKKELKEKPKIEVGSAEEEAYLNRLDADIANINDDYMNYTAEHADILDNEASQMSYMQKVRHMMMFSACASPLAHGVNPSSLVQSIGMYAGMRLVDKDFSNNVERGVADMLSPFVQKKAEEKGENSIWAKWADKLKKAGNDGRDPLDPETAALTQMGFVKKAYNDMRQPGADIDAISKSYEESVKGLYKVAAHDGVSGDDIRTQFNFMAGKMIERDPSAMKYFNETAYNGVSMADYKERTVAMMGDNGQAYEATTYEWSGEFTNKDGSEFTGTFTPRTPYTADSYSDIMREFCSDNLKAAVEKCPTDDLQTAVDSVTHEVKSSQNAEYDSINEKVNSGVINKSEASTMRRKVANLEDADIGVSDLSDVSKERITTAMASSLREYIKTDDWTKAKDNIYDTMMADDGMTQSDVMSIQTKAKQGSLAEAFVHTAHQVIDKSVDGIRAENAKRTAVNGSYKGRGHEFDDIFSEADLGDDVQYT